MALIERVEKLKCYQKCLYDILRVSNTYQARVVYIEVFSGLVSTFYASQLICCNVFPEKKRDNSDIQNLVTHGRAAWDLPPTNAICARG